MEQRLSPYIKRACYRLKNGDYKCKQKPIITNPFIDFKKFALYLKSLSKSDRTVKEYLYKIKDFSAEVSPQTLSRFGDFITFKDEYTWGKRKGEQYIVKDSTRKRKTYNIYNALQHYIIAIDKRDWKKYLPLKSEIANPVPESKTVDIKNTEIDQLISNASPDYALLFTVLRYTGMRITECLMLKKTWINFDTTPIEITIPIDISKSKKPGKVYILEEFAIELKKVCEKIKKNDYIFIFLPELYDKINLQNGTKIKVKAYNYVESEQLEVIFRMREFAPQRIKDIISPHWLRHAFAQQFYGSGTDLKQIQLLMRHANLETTNSYIHITEEQSKKTYMDIYG